MKALVKPMDLAVIVLICINAAGLGVFFWARRQAGLYRVGTRIPVPSGYLLDHAFLPPIAAPCYLVRVTADACPYCRADQHQLSKLVQRAVRAGCEAVTVAPKVGQMQARPGELQLQYVDMNLGRALNPFMTPQTLLLDSTGRVAWYRVGSLDDAALRGGFRALAEILAKPPSSAPALAKYR